MTAVLGRTVVGPADDPQADTRAPSEPVNVRHSLWSARWPAIALQTCIDTVEAAPPALQPQVRRELPCATCPENTRCLNAKRGEIGPLLFDREIQTSPRSSESSLFPRELMAPMLEVGLECLPHYRKPEYDGDRFVVVSGWDMAWSEKVGGDYLVKVTAVGDRMGRQPHRVIDIERHQRMSYPQQVALVEQHHHRYSTDLDVIEGDAMQIVYRQSLQEGTTVPVMSHHAAGQKRDLQSGVPGMIVDFTNRRWSFPYRRDGRGFDDVETLLAEFEAFGWEDGKLQGSGEHDDCVMAFWHCWWGMRLMLGQVGEIATGLQQGRE
ncbi:hypothetical protein [Actinomycetospora termitidis]|uniref:Terminase large subunit gp17-like C-terminal domain-containing protein n=1 Tax=Actinomycetospora termitidis TaxID=3053470 RepID=A0ABT7MFI1_9PSEU|nr:hypothetical protein [Actinomycetospora sp. Odt1-22]MDL5159430.1 hypothetical protein [Actinomycetospora sp. Odt1-22]